MTWKWPNPLKSALSRKLPGRPCWTPNPTQRENANPEPSVCLRVNGSDFESKKHELLLLESIDQGLVDLLGRRARDAIYDHLERKCYMARERSHKG